MSKQGFLEVKFSPTYGTKLEKLIHTIIKNDEFSTAVTWWGILVIQIVVFINLGGVHSDASEVMIANDVHQDHHTHGHLINDIVLFEYQ